MMGAINHIVAQQLEADRLRAAERVRRARALPAARHGGRRHRAHPRVHACAPAAGRATAAGSGLERWR
jgi:hypothetical protein